MVSSSMWFARRPPGCALMLLLTLMVCFEAFFNVVKCRYLFFKIVSVEDFWLRLRIHKLHFMAKKCTCQYMMHQPKNFF